MNKPSTPRTLVAAALIGIASGNAMSEEAIPAVAATPAPPSAAPGAGYAPGRYLQSWPQPARRRPPPPGYGQLYPYPPSYEQYRTAPGVPAENPLSNTLKQTQEQLAAQTTELEATRERVARLQSKLQTASEAMQKAQSDTINAGRQVDTSMAQVDSLKQILCELAARLEIRNAALQNTLHTTTAKPDDPASAAGDKLETVTADQAAPPVDPMCSQLTQSPAITSGQRGKTVLPPAR